ncbi:MAG: YceI family protein [Rickettsiales bacterium]|nr:YceI family protein [Rickettsiales bacterium]
MLYKFAALSVVFSILMMTSALPAYAEPEEYDIDPSHTSVVWSVNHFGFSTPSGKFAHLSGRVMLDEQEPENSSVSITIDTASVISGVAKLDEHLRGKDFFEVEKYAKATYISDSVVLSGTNKAKVKGKLTLHGVTKPVTLDVVLNKIGESPVTKKKTAGFTATAKLKRSDFNMTYGLPGVADEVQLNIESEAVLVSAAR